MKESNIAKTYAKSLVELSNEKKLDLVSELTEFTVLINQNNDLESVLFLETFTKEEKSSVIQAICEKTKFSDLTKNFLMFLLQEKRLGLYPMIYKNIIVIDDHNKGFLRGTVEGTEETLPEETRKKLEAFLNTKLNRETRLEYVKAEKMTAGYRVTVEDLQLDASVDHQLEKFKESVIQN